MMIEHWVIPSENKNANDITGIPATLANENCYYDFSHYVVQWDYTEWRNFVGKIELNGQENRGTNQSHFHIAPIHQDEIWGTAST